MEEQEEEVACCPCNFEIICHVYDCCLWCSIEVVFVTQVVFLLSTQLLFKLQQPGKVFLNNVFSFSISP